MLLKLSVLLLLLCSCFSDNHQSREFELILKEKFWEARSLEFNAPMMFLDKEVKDPPFTWRLLLTIDKKDCLFYRTPLEEEKGILRLVRADENECSGDSYTQEVIAEIEQVKNLSLHKIVKRESYLQKERDYQVKVKINHKDFAWQLIAPQVEAGLKKSFKPELLMSSASFQYNGVKEWLNDKLVRGDWEQRYSDGDFQFCHRVNKDCEDVEEFSCEECRFGWVEVIDHYCPQGGSKICGRDRCGERGEPACLRGRSFLEENVDGPCFADSLAGYCGPKLNTVCDENGVLICL